jgi:hypothetical protein
MVMITIGAFVVGSWFGFAIAAILAAAKDD